MSTDVLKVCTIFIFRIKEMLCKQRAGSKQFAASTMKLESVQFFETLVNSYRTTQYYISEYIVLFMVTVTQTSNSTSLSPICPLTWLVFNEHLFLGSHDLILKVKGTGMIANMVRSILGSFNIRQRVKNAFDNEGIFSHTISSNLTHS
jgi:hypothetical protein